MTGNSRPEILAIIPARGGSKSIPRKNIRVLGGKPLLAYSIEQAKRTPSITRTIVSTDDDEIAAVAQTYGAEVVHRPAEISGDTASSESALVHALDTLQQTEGYSPDLVVFLQATNPIREEGDLQNAINLLERENADSLLSVTPFHVFLWRKQPDGSVKSLTYDHANRPRRQDKPEDFIENGSFYVFKPWVLREYNNRLGGKVVVYPMDQLSYFGIDEPGDLEVLEHLLHALGQV
jgi:CMP-N,N'-diacetyllegionaminic acid synthase